MDPHEREFLPIREPRDRSRDRSLERGLYLEEELYGRAARQSPSQIRKQSILILDTAFRQLLGGS